MNSTPTHSKHPALGLVVALVVAVAPAVALAAVAARAARSADPPAAVFLPLQFSHYADCTTDLGDRADGVLTGGAAVWQPLALTFTGPPATPTGTPNPFLDYRLQVQMIAPSGRVYDVPGHFDGPSADGGRWRANFAADEPGLWHYCASFRHGAGVAVELDPDAGAPVAFDGAAGSFRVASADPDAPDFFRWGRLEYVGGHYLKFRDGPYWLKGGTNSPENFLGYAGFANTASHGGELPGFLHTYAPHVADSRPDDPPLPGGAGILGALNYLGQQGVNAIYFLPMNLGGDGQDTHPYLSTTDNTRFDVVKLAQWGVVLEHAQRRGIALHIVLNEIEEANRHWHDNGQLGPERRLFYREMVARFAHLPAVKWNLSEEMVFPPAQQREFAAWLAALDWAGHPIAVHNPPGRADALYGELLGDARFSATSFQYPPEMAGELVETWRARSAGAGRPWVIDMDENNPSASGLTTHNAGELRKEVLYDVYFSGGAGVEWYMGYHPLPLGGDLNVEDFRTRERMWRYMRYARRFMEENLPFHRMSPADERLRGESDAYGGGEVFALGDEVVAVYLPSAVSTGVLAVGPGDYTVRWYDPREGQFMGQPATVTVGASGLPLGPPPWNEMGDWVVLVVGE